MKYLFFIITLTASCLCVEDETLINDRAGLKAELHEKERIPTYKQTLLLTLQKSPHTRLSKEQFGRFLDLKQTNYPQFVQEFYEGGLTSPTKMFSLLPLNVVRDIYDYKDLRTRLNLPERIRTGKVSLARRTETRPSTLSMEDFESLLSGVGLNLDTYIENFSYELGKTMPKIMTLLPSTVTRKLLQQQIRQETEDGERVRRSFETLSTTIPSFVRTLLPRNITDLVPPLVIRECNFEQGDSLYERSLKFLRLGIKIHSADIIGATAIEKKRAVGICFVKSATIITQNMDNTLTPKEQDDLFTSASQTYYWAAKQFEENCPKMYLRYLFRSMVCSFKARKVRENFYLEGVSPTTTNLSTNHEKNLSRELKRLLVPASAS